MTVLEPGCGMGYFTIPMAQMVGSGGRVIVVDIQSKMLSALERRANKAGLGDRIVCRLAGDSGMGLEDFRGKVDFAVAIHVVHEMPDQGSFFAEVHDALKPGGKLLVVEPKGHVREGPFRETLSAAQQVGFQLDPAQSDIGRRMCLLHRSGVRIE
jgi:ubiquinone/menaquinone biosynthesis C-methylase UbiE